MKLADIFTGTGDPFVFYPGFVNRFNISVNACVFLCFVGWKTIPASDSWTNFNTSQITDATGLSLKEQAGARRQLRAANLIEEHYSRLEHCLKFKLSSVDLDTDLEAGNGGGHTPKGQMAISQNGGGHTPKGQMAICPKGDSSNNKELRKEKEAPPMPPIPENLRTPRFEAAWKDWVEERKQKRKPITPRAAALQFRKLARWGEAKAVLAIETAIASYWTGLFEPKPENGKPKPDYSRGC
jgi:hypothetical protein